MGVFSSKKDERKIPSRSIQLEIGDMQDYQQCGITVIHDLDRYDRSEVKANSKAFVEYFKRQTNPKRTHGGIVMVTLNSEQTFVWTPILKASGFKAKGSAFNNNSYNNIFIFTKVIRPKRRLL